MTGYRVFNFRFHSLTWVDFTKFINQVQLSLFSSYLFRQSYFMQGALCAPCNPVELHNCLSIKVIRQPICRHEQLSLSETLSGSRLSEHEVRVKAA